jgi:DNA-binding XRE family transcriptional regulator
MRKTSEAVQIVRDDKGAPLVVVVPWAEYERLKAGADEDARLIALATPHRGEEAFPADIAKLLIAGNNPVKVFRVWRGMTQQQLSTQSNVANQYISQIERGVRKVGRTVAKKLAPALGVSIDALMDI